MQIPAPDEPLGLYCHVPFCPASCDFCAFYQHKPHRKEVIAFLEGIGKEMALHSRISRVDTIYLGGGTPGLLSTGDLERLCRTLLRPLTAPPREWTVEMAPSTVKADKIRALRDLGVTRISMGVQSFHEALLDRLGRPHTPALARKAHDILRSAGFANVNLDMIFAVPGQTPDMLEADLEQAMELEPQHISTYCLTYEENTPLGHALSQGQVSRDPDREADLYLKTWEILEAGGYGQYEISNFAHPGFECLHNLNTWRMHQWIGLGPSAASQYGGARYCHPPDLHAWLDGLDPAAPARPDEVILPPRSPAEDEIVLPSRLLAGDAVILTPRLLAEDAVVFGLRMSRGIQPADLEARFSGLDLAFLDPLWKDLIQVGLMEEKAGHHLALTLKGRLVADRIGVEVMDAFDVNDGS